MIKISVTKPHSEDKEYIVNESMDYIKNNIGNIYSGNEEFINCTKVNTNDIILINPAYCCTVDISEVEECLK